MQKAKYLKGGVASQAFMLPWSLPLFSRIPKETTNHREYSTGAAEGGYPKSPLGGPRRGLININGPNMLVVAGW